MAVIFGFQVLGVVFGAAVIAMLAVASAGVRHLERDHDGTFGKPVQGSAPDDAKRFG
jgi:hypothetical protein